MNATFFYAQPFLNTKLCNNLCLKVKSFLSIPSEVIKDINTVLKKRGKGWRKTRKIHMTLNTRQLLSDLRERDFKDGIRHQNGSRLYSEAEHIMSVERGSHQRRGWWQRDRKVYMPNIYSGGTSERSRLLWFVIQWEKLYTLTQSTFIEAYSNKRDPYYAGILDTFDHQFCRTGIEVVAMFTHRMAKIETLIIHKPTVNGNTIIVSKTSRFKGFTGPWQTKCPKPTNYELEKACKSNGIYNSKMKCIDRFLVLYYDN